MTITNKQVDDMICKLGVAFGVSTKDELVDEMVDRFLSWKLPKDFCPDAGISFKPTNPDGCDERGWWPIGTNLLTAYQAREMITYILNMEKHK